MTLEEAVQQLVNLGATDPVEIAEKLEALHGRKWIVANLEPLALEIVTEIGRRILGQERRRAEIALRPRVEITQAEIKIKKTWIPGRGWKAIGDCTADDLDTKAHWYERFAQASLARAWWYREAAALMRAEGANQLKRLKADLPALPDEGDDLKELAA